MLRSISLYLICCSISLSAATKKATSYDDAKSQANKNKQPYDAVLIHGRSWHKASQLFLDQLWYSEQLSQSVTLPLIIADIHVQQHLSKEQAKEAGKNSKGWKHSKVRSFPALQFYDSSGNLLKSYQGSELRKISSISALTSHLNGLIKATNKRNILYKQLDQSRKDKSKQLEAELLGELIQLPINFDKKSLLAQLKAADPEDHTGWQAQISFNNWGYMRHITGLINGKKIDQALKETEGALKKEGYSPQQLCMIPC